MTRYVEAIDAVDPIDRKALQRLLDRLPPTPEMVSLEERSKVQKPLKQAVRPITFEHNASFADRAAVTKEWREKSPPDRLGTMRAVAFQQDDGPIDFADAWAMPAAESVESQGWAFFRNRKRGERRGA